MKARRHLAAAVLAAVTLCVGTLNAPLPQSTANEATTQVIDGPGTAQWLLIIGFSRSVAWHASGWVSSDLIMRIRVAL